MLINYDAVNDNDHSDLHLISYASVQTFPMAGRKQGVADPRTTRVRWISQKPCDRRNRRKLFQNQSKLGQNLKIQKSLQNLSKILKRPATMDPKRKEFYFFEWLNWIKMNGLIFTYQMPFNILLTSCVNVFFWEILLIILYLSRSVRSLWSHVISRLEK